MVYEAAVILAGGLGKRAWPLTATREKPLLPLPGGHSILGRLVLQARRVAQRVYILAPPGKGSLFHEELEKEGVTVDGVVEQPEYSSGYGSGYAARVALEKLGLEGNVLILNGDSVIHDKVFDAIGPLAEAKKPLVVGVELEVTEPGRFGALAAEGDKLKGIIEKGGHTGRLLVNAGIYALPASEALEALENLRPSPRGEYEITDAVNILAKRMDIIVVRAPGGYWRDVGTWWDYLAANRMVLDWLLEAGECKSEGEIAQNATIRGPVCGEGFVIESHSVVEGPVWFSKGVEIGPLAHIRPYTIVYAGASLGSFVEVKGSVILENVKARHLAYIGDSVVAEGVNIAAGTIVANLRHDSRTVRSCAGGRVFDTGFRKLGAAIGAFVKTGVNSTISPGTRIGPCTWLEEGAHARHDIPSCSLLRRDGTLVEITELNRECCSRLRWRRGVGLCTARG